MHAVDFVAKPCTSPLMWRAFLCAGLLLTGCKRGGNRAEAVLPDVEPDTVVVSWSVISRSDERRSMYVVLQGNREMVVMTRSPNGTMMSVSHEVSEKDYADLVGQLRALDCCALQSTSRDRARPSEAKPQLEIDFGDVECEIALWDDEWLEGRAKECGFAFARLHRSGFVPDPPVDEPTP